MGIINDITVINGCKKFQYSKNYFINVKFNSCDNLPLNKPLQSSTITLVVRSVFEDGKFYPQIYLDECLYEL